MAVYIARLMISSKVVLSSKATSNNCLPLESIIALNDKNNNAVYNLCMDSSLYSCIHKMQEFIYPGNVALPVGGSVTPRYVVMETHYDNPKSVSGL